MSLAILKDLANGTDGRILSKNDTELFISMNRKAVYEKVDSSYAQS